MNRSPDEILDRADPGSETQARFSYQHGYAAIQFVESVRADSMLDVVYCENFEDVLLRLKSGHFVGIQVKTRAVRRQPFRATEEEIRRTIVRFAALERDFPGTFQIFCFATNHCLWEEQENGANLRYVRDGLCARGSVKGLPRRNPFRAFMDAICELADCEEAHVLGVLSKLRLQCAQAGLEHIEHDLHTCLCEVCDHLAKRYSFTVLRRVADNLVYRAYEASRTRYGPGVASLYDVLQDFDAKRDELILRNKATDADDVRRIIAAALPADAENLLVSRTGASEGFPSGTGIMTRKLARGGLQKERIDVLKDYKHSAESLYLRWTMKDGVDRANERLDHLKVLVADDCAEAKVHAAQSVDPAPLMYEHLRARLRRRAADSSEQLFGCRQGQLLGIAGMLTEECRVWWSECFELDGDAA